MPSFCVTKLLVGFSNQILLHLEYHLLTQLLNQFFCFDPNQVDEEILITFVLHTGKIEFFKEWIVRMNGKASKKFEKVIKIFFKFARNVVATHLQPSSNCAGTFVRLRTH